MLVIKDHEVLWSNGLEWEIGSFESRLKSSLSENQVERGDELQWISQRLWSYSGVRGDGSPSHLPWSSQAQVLNWSSWLTTQPIILVVLSTKKCKICSRAYLIFVIFICHHILRPRNYTPKVVLVFLVFGIGYLVFARVYSVFGMMFSISGMVYLVFKMVYLVYGTMYLVS